MGCTSWMTPIAPHSLTWDKEKAVKLAICLQVMMFANGCHFLENERISQNLFILFFMVTCCCWEIWSGNFLEVSFKHVFLGKNEKISIYQPPENCFMNIGDVACSLLCGHPVGGNSISKWTRMFVALFRGSISGEKIWLKICVVLELVPPKV